MSRPIDPMASASGDRRVHRGRRKQDAFSPAAPSASADAASPSGAAAAADPIAAIGKGPAPILSAHLLGQATGHKREAQPSAQIIDRARSAYLGVEWSGQADRRSGRGRMAKTEV